MTLHVHIPARSDEDSDGRDDLEVDDSSYGELPDWDTADEARAADQYEHAMGW